MGFFASELAAALQAHVRSNQSPWAVLSRLGVHPQQIDRLKKAAEDFGLVASLKMEVIVQIEQEIEATRYTHFRLMAALDADQMLRLMAYHNYPVDEIANNANALFNASLLDMMASGSEQVFPKRKDDGQEAPPPSELPRRRGRPPAPPAHSD